MATECDRAEILAVTVVSASLATVFLLPLFAPGSLLHFDLVATPHTEITPGVWGLGPELPRLGPLEIVLAATGRVIGGAAAVTLFLWVSMVGATTGGHLLARRWGAERWTAAGAAILYGCGPWLVTRITVGHLTMVGAAAILPFVLPRVLGPDTTRWSVASAAAAMALFGSGGLLAGSLVVAGLVAGSVRRRDVPIAALVQSVWVVPSALVFLAPGDSTGAAAFPSGVDEVADVAGLIIGAGFWQDVLQVGGDTSVVDALIGILVLTAAAVGAVGFDRRRRRALGLLALVPMALVIADSLPVVRDAYGRVSDIGPLVVLREPQRLISLTLVVVAPLAAVGVTRSRPAHHRCSRPRGASSSWFSRCSSPRPAIVRVRDAIDPTVLPPEWEQARQEIAARPGAVLVLPWERYLDIGLVGGRRVLNPALAFFGGDVRISGDLGLAERSEERRDPRSAAVEDGLARLQGRTTDASFLADLGIDWVLLLHEIDYTRHLGLLDDDALESVIAAGSLDLLRVADATGPAETLDGEAVAVRRLLDPLARIEAPGNVVWDHAYQWGWMRGMTPAGRTEDGRLLLEGSSSLVWYWPALMVVGAWVGAGIALARARSAG